MGRRNYRSYTAEFKDEALMLLKKWQKRRQLERELGITPGLLRKWLAKYQAVQKKVLEVRSTWQPSDLEAANREILRLEVPGWRESWGKRRGTQKERIVFLPDKRMRYEFIAAH